MALTLTVPRADWVWESFFAILEGKDPIPETAPLAQTVVGGTAEGMVTGGCLCLLADSIGTPNSLDCDSKIVLIEDVDENPHRIDAMLTHLLNAGIIQRAAGIVIGEMTRTDERCDEGIGARPWREIVRDRLGNLGIPLVTDLPFGHGPQMLSLPLGIRARLDANAGRLSYLESLCA
jgi:muramoyltetrapeptide carboxypeptidase